MIVRYLLGCLLFFFSVACVSGRLVSLNVTVSGVVYEKAVVMPDVWGIVLKGLSVKGVQGTSLLCPAGRYCPAGTSEPLLCDAGKFSATYGRSTKCVGDCQANYYCPDPGKRVPCPSNTHSGWGKVSQSDCKCDDGFQCVYKKRINLNIVLNVPYKVWVGSGGAGLKAALLQAVAESAGVSAGNVQIEQVLPSVVSGPGPGSGRRLLGKSAAWGERGKGAAMLKVSVVGAEKVEGLQERLGKRAEFRGGARVHWRRVDNLKVMPAPRDSGWDWRAWVGRRA
jgi:hypothetical protein